MSRIGKHKATNSFNIKRDSGDINNPIHLVINTTGTPMIHKKIHEGIRMSNNTAQYKIMYRQSMQTMNSTTHVVRPIDKTIN